MTGFRKGMCVEGTFNHRRLDVIMLSFFKELGIPASEWADPGLDVTGTPRRIVKMLQEELLASYKPGSLDDLRSRFTVFRSDGLDSMVHEGPIDFHSLCAHHLLPFSGQVYVSYVPDGWLIGASKLPRVVEHYARMLQIQERLGRQIAEFVHDQATAKLVIVLIVASHLCMKCRGVKQQRTRMLTTAIMPHPTTWASGEEVHFRGMLNEFYSQLNLLKTDER